MLAYTLKQILPRRVWECLKRARQRLLGRRAYMNPSYSIEGEDRIVRALLWQKTTKDSMSMWGRTTPFASQILICFTRKAGAGSISMRLRAV